MTEATAFYCVTDSRYFLGAVGLVNSLRLQGHTEPVYVLDVGLTQGQRELLEDGATVVPGPAGTPPWLAKTIAPLAHPAGVMVLLDADMIVTRPLDDVIEAARAGKVVAFENNVDRFVPDWERILGLGPIERRRYLCSACVALPADPGADVLRLLEDRQRAVEFDRHVFNVDMLSQRTEPGPFHYPDQDLLNAILASRVDAAGVVGLPTRLMALTPFGDLEPAPGGPLRCAYPDGTEPYLLHHIMPGKPWLQPMPDGLYSRLLRRLLNGDDVVIRVPAPQVPVRLRRGVRAQLVRRFEVAWLRIRIFAGLWRARLGGALRSILQRRAVAR